MHLHASVWSLPTCLTHHRHYAGASSNGSGKAASRKQAAKSKEDTDEGGKLAAYAAPAAILTGLAILIGVGVAYKRELKDFIEQFVAVLDTWGPVRSALDLQAHASQDPGAAGALLLGCARALEH